jgi:hypothetical protein
MSTMATNDDNKPSFFARYIDNPPPIKKAQEPSPAQKLLDWLQRDLARPSISTRQICIYGPNAVRNRKRANDAAEILAKEGWLVPIQTRRRDMKAWSIVRKPIIFPTVATETAE